MRAVLCLYQFGGLFLHCYCEPSSQKQWLNSLTPRKASLSVSNNIPWLVPMPETWQGIVLNRWWILSMASCLIKLKYLHSEISGMINQEDTLFVHKLCLHRGFAPQIGTDRVKGNIGVVFLQYPIRREEMPLSHTHNNFWKTCYNCQYRHCSVYQYQNCNLFGTSFEKLSVKLLDLSFCQKPHLHLTESNNLCIWSQAQEEYWVQQGSPVLCLFGNYWELVGLVSESSVACCDPVLVIKMAPFPSWMRRLIEASQKLLDPVFPLSCSFSPRVEYGPQNRLSLNMGSAILTSHGFTIQSYRTLDTLALKRQRRNRPPIFFGSNNRDSFSGSRHLHLQHSQQSSASKLPMVKSWTLPIAQPWDPSVIADPWSTPRADISESWDLSDPQNPLTTGIPISWDLPQRDSVKHQHRTVTESVRSWVKQSASIIGLHILLLVSANENCVLFSSDITGFQIPSEITAVQSQVQATKTPFDGQLLARPWLEITPDIGPWTHSVLEKTTETVMQVQSNEETVRTQIHYVAGKVNPVVKPVTYNLRSRVPLIGNEIEFRTHFTLNANGYHYPTVTYTLEPWFQPAPNIVGSQEPIEKTNKYWILPEPKSTQFWIYSEFNMPFSLASSADSSVMSWAQYKASVIRPSSQMYSISILSKHTITDKPQMKTECTSWLLFHPITNLIKSFIHSKADRTQPEADIMQTWTQSETQAGRSFSQLKADTIRPWLQTKTEVTMPWIHSKIKIVRPRTEENKGRHWNQGEADTIRSWTSSEIETIRPRKEPEAEKARSWFWTKSDQMRLKTQPDLTTLHPWIQNDINMVKPWIQSEGGGIQPWAKPELSTFRYLTQSMGNIVPHWTSPETDAVRFWLQTQTYTIKTWSQIDSQTDMSWSELEANIARSWLHPQMDTFKPWTETEFQRAHSWTQLEGDRARLGTQSETDHVKLWFHTQMETIILWTEPVMKTAHHWKRSEMERVSPRNQPVDDKVKAWVQRDVNTVRLWDEQEGNNVRFWTQYEADPVRPWIQPDIGIINPRAQNDTDTLIPSTQAESLEVNPWTQSETETVTPSIQSETPGVNYWQQLLTKPVTTRAKTKFSGQKLLTHPASDTVVIQRTQAKSIAISLWTQPLADTVTLWAQSKTSEINPWTKTIADIVTTLTQFESPVVNPQIKQIKTESKQPWRVPKPSIFSISLHPQIDTTPSLITVENQASFLWTHPKTDNINSWALSKFGTFISCVVPLPHAARLWLYSEADISRSWLKTETTRIRPWGQSESQTVSTLTQFGPGRVDLLAQHETATMLSCVQTKTDVFHPGNQFEGDTVRFWTFSEADIVRPWIKKEAGTISLWTQPKSSTFRPWAQPESEAVRPWTQSEANMFTLLPPSEMQAAKPLTVTDINMVRSWFQTQFGAIKQGTQPQSQIATPRNQPKWQTAYPWIQHKTNTVRFWPHPEGELAQLWTQTETNTVRLWTHHESDKVKPWTQPELQFVSSWTDVDTVTFWYLMQNGTIRPQYPIESQMPCSQTQNEVDIIIPWTQHESNSIRSWTKLETATIHPWIHLETTAIRPWTLAETLKVYPSTQVDTNTVIRHWFQIQIDSVEPWNLQEAIMAKPSTQPETETLHIWSQTERQLVKPITLSEVDTITPLLQNQSNTSRAWIQPDSQTDIPLTQANVSVVHPWTQQGAVTNQPWMYPETQAVKPWVNMEANTVRSWFHIQMNKVTPWTHSEFQVFSPQIYPEVGIVESWIQSETQEGRPWAHPETDIIASFAILTLDKVKTWIPHEKEIKSDSHYKADIITSFVPLEVELNRATPLTSQFGSWSKPVPLLQTETILATDQYFIIALSTEIPATESQDQINSLLPSELTNILLLTLSSTWLPGRVDYLNFGSNLQITKTKGIPYVPSNFLSPLSPSFSFLVPCSLPTPCALSHSCSSFFSSTLPSSCISPYCSILSLTAFSPVLLTLASFDNSPQELSTSKFTEETFLSHGLSSLHAAPITFLTKQLYQMPGSEFETKSKQLEQEPLKNSELNVSLAECHLGLVWKESLQAFWLFKTAVISHETTECGLRPGLVPQCPNCWEAEVGEFPWMVSVQLSFSHFCAGSILNEQWILTTARCANFIKNSEALALVQVGLTDLQEPTQAQTVGIHRAMPYVGPKGPLGPGLIFLKQPLHFQPLVLPICLEESLEQEKNIQLYDCWLPTWSLMRGSLGILQKRHLSILKVSSCAQFWPKLNEFTFCIEAKKAVGEAGCKGDLGAPLVCRLQQKDTWVQVGILSHFDEHCAKPYVFSQVSPFLFWLQEVTRPSHAPWSQQGPMTTSASNSLSVSTSMNASAVTSTTASIRPHFISLPQPQTLADRISLRYAMPWQAIIISCGSQICSGSIVSSSWVLTAAHCVRNMNPEDTAVILGLWHSGAPLKVVKVSTILLHERFRLVSGAARNDLALLLLQEVQTPIQLLAPLGHLKNLNSSECRLSGPRILKPGQTDENPEMLQMQVTGASSCAYLYPDIGSSSVCFMTEAKGSITNAEPVSPGSAVMCRPISGNGSWRQIGLTSLKDLATAVRPYFSWIITTSAKGGHPINQAVMTLIEKPKSSGLLKQPNTLSLSCVMIIVLQSLL